MSTIRITNISSERIWIRDLYTGLAPGEVKEIERTPAECGSMSGLQAAISDGSVSVTVTPDSFEVESKLVPIWPLGMNWRPAVALVGDLPATDNTVGDLRVVTGTLGLYGWNGAAWQAVGGGGGGVTSVTASAPIASSGGATPNITLNTVPVNKGGTGITSAGAAGNVLVSDGSAWVSQAPAPSGVSSVSASAPLASSGGATPDISLTGTIPVGNGGTGFTTAALGDLVFASAANTLGKLADVAVGNALLSGGVGAAPSYGKVGLATHVSGTLPVANGGTGITSAGTSGNVLTSDGTNWASVAPAAAKQLGSRIHWVVAGGLYASIQAAIDAASAGDVILVGPAPSGAPQNGSWGAAVFPENKRLIVSGLTGNDSQKNIRIDSVTFSPSSAGLQINENEIYISGLYIIGTYAAGQQAVLFDGTNAGRMRLSNCYIYANALSTGGDCVKNSNAFAGTSLHLDGCLIQNASTNGRGIRHSGTYTYLRNRNEVSGGQYAIEQSAGLMEIYDASIQMDAAREVIQISAGTMTVGYSTIKNTTANGSGVNLTAAGAVFGMGDATFAIATGTGYCVNGVASSFFLYGHITYSNSAAAAYNTRVRSSVLTAFATTQAFTAV